VFRCGRFQSSERFTYTPAVSELASSWAGRARQGAAFAARLPLWRYTTSTGVALQAPQSVAFYLGPRCNLTCRHCAFYGDGPGVAFEDYCRVLRETWDLGARELTLAGGEPTLIKDFPRYLRHAVKMGWVVGFTTNGTTLRGRLLGEIAASGVQRLSISLDGLEANHDAVRGAGNFRLAATGLDGVLGAIDRRHTDVRVNMVLMRHNLADVLPLHQWVAEKKVWFNVMPFTTDNLTHRNDGIDANLALDGDAIARLTTLLPDWVAQRRRLGWWLNTRRHLDEIARFARTGQRRRRCFIGAYQFNVDEQLRVGFCTADIGFAGDLTRQSARDIWHGRAAAAARRKIGQCRACVLNCYYTPSLWEAATDLLPVLARSQ